VGKRFANLTWSSTHADRVALYRNGERIATIPNRGGYTDTIPEGVRGPFKYEVGPASKACTSNTLTIDF
jgi:hypothetical protein